MCWQLKFLSLYPDVSLEFHDCIYYLLGILDVWLKISKMGHLLLLPHKPASPSVTPILREHGHHAMPARAHDTNLESSLVSLSLLHSITKSCGCYVQRSNPFSSFPLYYHHLVKVPSVSLAEASAQPPIGCCPSQIHPLHSSEVIPPTRLWLVTHI